MVSHPISWISWSSSAVRLPEVGRCTPECKRTQTLPLYGTPLPTFEWEAYSPIGSSNSSFAKINVLQLPVITKLAEKYGKTPAQIALQWNVHQGHSVLPKSVNADRIASHIDLFDFKISEEDLGESSSLYYKNSKSSWFKSISAPHCLQKPHQINTARDAPSQIMHLHTVREDAAEEITTSKRGVKPLKKLQVTTDYDRVYGARTPSSTTTSVCDEKGDRQLVIVGARLHAASCGCNADLGRASGGDDVLKNPPDWQEILTYFRGSELQNYFTRILEDNLKAVIKQQLDHMPKAVKGNVGEVLAQKDEREMRFELAKDLDLNQVLDRDVGDLSGGELQRFAIAVVATQHAEIYMFDEPSSYLDVKQRLKAAQVVRSLLRPNSYVIVVEHDLSVLDYLSDFICCLYGKPGAYGVVTLPFSVREGINIFLAGFVPTENLRFRDESLTFKVAETPQESAEEIRTYARYKYPQMTKTQGGFKLAVKEGEFTDSQIIVMLGENGTGKTTFIRMLAGLLKPDEAAGDGDVEVPEFNVSYKPQKFSPKFASTVRDLLHQKIRDSCMHPQFNSDVIKPLKIEALMDQKFVHLSGGELQRVALCLCLGKPADIYLIDEPSAYLDSEQRIVAAKVIKRFILHAKKTAFVVEHDFIMATYLADRVIVYEGQPSIDCVANTPQSLLTGMNLFLSHLDITFRRDPTNYRPRINKLDSTKDREQKNAGSYYYLDD